MNEIQEKEMLAMTNPEITEVEQATGNTSGGWFDNALNFGSSLLQNSGQIASIFSPSYRADQLALAQAQAAQQRGLLNNQNNNTNLFIIIGAVVLIVILLVFLLKSKS